MRRLPGVTIDSKKARDLDDAFWVEKVSGGWTVTVAITNVADAVKPGSEADLNARRQGRTVYSEEAEPCFMLPADLVVGRLSLKCPHEPNVLAIVISLDNERLVRGVEFTRAVLDNQGQLTYRLASNILGQKDHHLFEMLSHAWELSAALRDDRQRAGAFTYVSLISNTLTDPEGIPYAVEDFHQTLRSHVIVEELMILANASTARWAVQQEIPFIFRNHRSSVTAVRKCLTQDLAMMADRQPGARVAAERFELLYGCTTLGTVATGHFSLAVPVYAWSTSPLRRYVDLVNQRLILARISGQPSPYSTDELDAIAQEMTILSGIDKQAALTDLRSSVTEPSKPPLAEDELWKLPKNEFESLVNRVARTGSCSPTMVANIEKRMLNDELTIPMLTSLLFPSAELPERIAHVILLYLSDSATLSMGILHHLSVKDPDTSINLEENKQHGRHHCVATIEQGGTEFRGHKVTGATVNKARQRAATSLLCSLLNPAWLPPSTWTKISSTFSAQETNWKGKLLEHCAKHKIQPPVFDVHIEDGGDVKAFVSIMKADGSNIMKDGEGTTLAIAQRVASEKLVRILYDLPAATFARTAGVDKEEKYVCPKNRLQSYCMKQRAPFPVYETTAVVTSGKHMFEACASVVMNDVQHVSVPCQAASKKQAEFLAAGDLLEKLTFLEEEQKPDKEAA